MQKQNRNSLSHEYIACNLRNTMLRIVLNQFPTNVAAKRSNWKPDLQTKLAT